PRLQAMGGPLRPSLIRTAHSSFQHARRAPACSCTQRSLRSSHRPTLPKETAMRSLLLLPLALIFSACANDNQQSMNLKNSTATQLEAGCKNNKQSVNAVDSHTSQVQ